MNCSSQCDSALCFIHAGVNRQEGLEIMQRLCGLSTVITAMNVMSEQFSFISVKTTLQLTHISFTHKEITDEQRSGAAERTSDDTFSTDPGPFKRKGQHGGPMNV